MALSRAAAAAARKAAKNRGLQGNRAKDGSLTTLEDIGFTGKEGREMRAAGYHDNVDLEKAAASMSDNELVKALEDAEKLVDDLEARMSIDKSELENMPNSEYAQQIGAEYDRAVQKMRILEEEYLVRDYKIRANFPKEDV